MKSVRVAIVGISGRMGREITQLIHEDKTLSISGGVGSSNTKEKSVVKTVEALKPNEIDGVVDFSSPEVFSELLLWSIKNKKFVVSGTTGISEAQKKEMHSASKKIPIFWAPNMSIGVAVLNKVLENLPKLNEFDIQVEEFHHSKKKDRPSGTAVLLQKTVETSQKKKLPETVSVRGGGIFGIHNVYFMSNQEILTFSHTALNRTVFAKGAVAAAKWLSKKEPGLYNMKDLLADLS